MCDKCSWEDIGCCILTYVSLGYVFGICGGPCEGCRCVPWPGVEWCNNRNKGWVGTMLEIPPADATME